MMSSHDGTSSSYSSAAVIYGMIYAVASDFTENQKKLKAVVRLRHGESGATKVGLFERICPFYVRFQDS